MGGPADKSEQTLGARSTSALRRWQSHHRSRILNCQRDRFLALVNHRGGFSSVGIFARWTLPWPAWTTAYASLESAKARSISL